MFLRCYRFVSAFEANAASIAVRSCRTGQPVSWPSAITEETEATDVISAYRFLPWPLETDLGSVTYDGNRSAWSSWDWQAFLPFSTAWAMPPLWGPEPNLAKSSQSVWTCEWNTAILKVYDAFTKKNLPVTHLQVYRIATHYSWTFGTCVTCISLSPLLQRGFWTAGSSNSP